MADEEGEPDGRTGPAVAAEDLDVEPSPTAEEAAAIVAAVEATLSDERAALAAAAAARAAAGDSWDGRRWAFRGRLDAVGIEGRRVPDGAPIDAWAAAGRADRF